MDENENKLSENPPRRWRETLAIGVMLAAYLLLTLALLAAAQACFFFLPGPFKALCIVPLFLLSMFCTEESTLFEICVFVVVWALLLWMSYRVILSKIESATTHESGTTKIISRPHCPDPAAI
jgi:hypothetical protein